MRRADDRLVDALRRRDKEITNWSQATVETLQKRVAELERNEHGHCETCGKPTPTGCMTRCHPETPCPKARAA